MISNFENLNLELLGDVNVEFVKILELAVKNSLQLGNVKKKRTRKSQIWYLTPNVVTSKRNLIMFQIKNTNAL